MFEREACHETKLFDQYYKQNRLLKIKAMVDIFFRNLPVNNLHAH